MIPSILNGKILSVLREKLGKNCTILDTCYLSGGCINEVIKIHTTSGDFFLKWNSATRYPKMFEQEVKGLKLLKEADNIKVPDVLTYGEIGAYSFLLLEFIVSALQIKNFWEDFGTSLAMLHRHTSGYFGLDHDNYIGSLVQKNTMHNNWISFFVEERIEKQLKMVYNDGKISKKLLEKFAKLYKVLPEIFPDEPSALLHGDLWNGNYIISSQGKACIIDPAVYYGHREIDLGMSRLFGGFSPAFYTAYHETYPLEKGWKNRLDICNLYPLLVHVNLFGGGYLSSVEAILQKY